MATEKGLHLVLMASNEINEAYLASVVDSLQIEQVSVLVEESAPNLGFIEKQGIKLTCRCLSVKNLNIALRENENLDVLLLRTEMKVSYSDVSQMKVCAYSDESIAAVMPLMPVFHLMNGAVLPVCKEEERKELAESVRRFGHDLIRGEEVVPYVLDQCCIIRADKLRKCLYLDEDNYTSIPYALVDWCYRAEQFGYRCLLCGQAYANVLEQSTRQPDEEENIKKLENTYPAFFAQASQFNWSKITGRIIREITLKEILGNGRKNILYILHRDFSDDAQDHIGGTQFHVKDLVRYIRKEYNAVVLARDYGCVRLSVYDEYKRVVVRIPISDAAPYPRLFDKELADMMRELYRAIHFDLVHIHHTYQLSLDVFAQTQQAGIPMLCTLHDYYFLCPTLKMLDSKNCCCIDHINEEECSTCWKMRSGDLGLPGTIEYLNRWREENLNALQMCEMIFTPSNSAKEIFSSYYPSLKEKIKIVPHGIEQMPQYELESQLAKGDANAEGIIDKMPNERNMQMTGWCILKGVNSEQCDIKVLITVKDMEPMLLSTEKMAREDIAQKYGLQHRMSGFSVTVSRLVLMRNAKVDLCISYKNELYRRGKPQVLKSAMRIRNRDFNVAFVGGLSIEKGSQIALEMIRKGPTDIGWFLIGGCGDRQLKYCGIKNFIDIGWYQREELAALLRLMHIDLICILPILPETFCYVLSEAMMCGIPVLATDIGALGERVRKDKSGWLIPVKDAAQNALKTIEEIRRSPQEIKTVREHLESMKYRSIEEMDRDYLEYYKEFRSGNIKETTFDYERLMQIGNQDANQLWEELQVTRSRLIEVENSRAYKAAKVFEQIRFPGKSQVMSLAYCLAKKMRMKV